MNIRRIEKEDLKSIVEAGFPFKGCPISFLEELKNTAWKQNTHGLIEWLFNENLGVIARDENGKLAGYMLFAGPMDGFFGNCNGAFSPLGCSWILPELASEQRSDLMSRLLQKGMELLVSKKITSVALSEPVWDNDISKALSLSGFGIRCSDTIMKIKDGDFNCRKNCDPSVIFEEVAPGKNDLIKPLFSELEGHLASSPCFFPPEEGCFEIWNERYEPKIIVAKADGKLAGHIAFTDKEGENFISRNSGVLNICGMFVKKEFRSKGIADGLLKSVYETARKQGFNFLGVDFETLNPNALHFWTKYFEPYTYSWHRRIDERILEGKQKNGNKIC